MGTTALALLCSLEALVVSRVFRAIAAWAILRHSAVHTQPANALHDRFVLAVVRRRCARLSRRLWGRGGSRVSRSLLGPDGLLGRLGRGNLLVADRKLDRTGGGTCAK